MLSTKESKSYTNTVFFLDTAESLLNTVEDMLRGLALSGLHTSRNILIQM